MNAGLSSFHCVLLVMHSSAIDSWQRVYCNGGTRLLLSILKMKRQ